jgi:hypothetical protein
MHACIHMCGSYLLVQISCFIYNTAYMMHVYTACINQDSANPAEQLNGSLGRIIGSCDFMVTPIHDPHWRKWSVQNKKDSLKDTTYLEIKDIFTDYLAPAFVEYLARGWCRLEMFFSANVPISKGRAKFFGGKLQVMMTAEKRRPHLVFGTREKDLNEMPLILRCLRDDEFDLYHPGKGHLTNKRDTFVIHAYVEELFKINSKLKVHLQFLLFCGPCVFYHMNMS